MASAFFQDDNGLPLNAAGGLRPVFSAAGQAEATTGAAIAELDISALNVAGNRNAQTQMMIMVTCISNACYFSLGAAATAPADTTTMMLIAANASVFMRVKTTDVSAYHKQITGAGTLHVCVLA